MSTVIPSTTVPALGDELARGLLADTELGGNPAAPGVGLDQLGDLVGSIRVNVLDDQFCGHMCTICPMCHIRDVTIVGAPRRRHAGINRPGQPDTPRLRLTGSTRVSTLSDRRWGVLGTVA